MKKIIVINLDNIITIVYLCVWWKNASIKYSAVYSTPWIILLSEYWF